MHGTSATGHYQTGRAHGYCVDKTLRTLSSKTTPGCAAAAATAPAVSDEIVSDSTPAPISAGCCVPCPVEFASPLWRCTGTTGGVLTVPQRTLYSIPECCASSPDNFSLRLGSLGVRGDEVLTSTSATAAVSAAFSPAGCSCLLLEIGLSCCVVRMSSSTLSYTRSSSSALLRSLFP